MTAPATKNQRTTLKPTAPLTLPNMPDTSPALQATLRQVLERLAVLDGQRGDDLDAAVTKRELVDAGIATIKRGAGGVSLEQGYDGGEWANIPYLDFMPTPSAPTFKTGIGVNFLFWQMPNARGVGATEVFRRTNDLDGAIIASPVGAMYADLPVEFATTYFYKIRYVSELGQAGDWSPEVEVLSEVDPSYVIEVISGQVNESVLAQELRQRIGVDGELDSAIGQVALDVEQVAAEVRGELAEAIGQATLDAQSYVDAATETLVGAIATTNDDLIEAINAADTAQTRARELVRQTAESAVDFAEDAAAGLLGAALLMQEIRTEMRDAGIDIDPASGTARLYAIDQTKDRLSTAEIELNAVKGTLSQKVSLVEVNQAISAAVLDPQQLPELSDLRGRVTDLEFDLNAAEGAITQRATVAEFTAAEQRLTIAESEVNALKGQIVDKVGSTTFDALGARVTTAEQTLSILDGAGVRTIVGDVRLLDKKSTVDANTALENILANQANAEKTALVSQQLAVAKDELTAKMEDGISSEAARRMVLAAQLDDAVSLITSEQAARATADEALATSVSLLSVEVSDNKALLLNDYYVKTTVDAAIVAGKDAAIASANGNTATKLNDYYTKADTNSAITEASETMLSKIGTVDAEGNLVDLNAVVQNKYATKAEVVDGVKSAEATAKRIVGASADGVYEQLLANAVGTHISTVDAAAVQIQNFAGYAETITSSLQEGISAEAAKRELLASVVAGNAAIVAQESITRANADSALSGLITSLGSKVDDNQASITQNYYTKADTNSAITVAGTALKAQMEAPEGSIGALSANLTNNYYTKTTTKEAIAAAQLSLLVSNTGEKKTFAQVSAPTQTSTSVTLADGTVKTTNKLNAGDLWFDTSDFTKVVTKVWDGTAWVETKTKDVNAIQASLTNDYYTKQTADAAIAANVRALGASIFTTDAEGNVTKTLQAQFKETITAEVDADGTARAAVRNMLEVGGKPSGFGFDNDGHISNFYINADSFAILGSTEDGEIGITPFVVDGGTTYINNAMIKDASISTAKIADLNTTVAKIAKASIFDAEVGGKISSSDYDGDLKNGWAVHQDGGAEFYGNNVVFGGKLEVRRVASVAGVDITNDGIRVYDDSGVLRVVIGKLN